MGFPKGNDKGQTNIFRAVKQCLPGPVSIMNIFPLYDDSLPSVIQLLSVDDCLMVQYTFILPASKQLPKQCITHGKTTMCSWRKHVGVRMPDDAICQAILNMLDAPLICTRSALS